MTYGASTAAAAPTATSISPVWTMNLRRLVMTRASSSPDVLLIGALGDVVPGSDQALELREGGVHLPPHRASLRLCSNLVGRQLLEIAQHGRREQQHLDASLELGPEPLERDRVLCVV